MAAVLGWRSLQHYDCNNTHLHIARPAAAAKMRPQCEPAVHRGPRMKPCCAKARKQCWSTHLLLPWGLRPATAPGCRVVSIFRRAMAGTGRLLAKRYVANAGNVDYGSRCLVLTATLPGPTPPSPSYRLTSEAPSVGSTALRAACHVPAFVPTRAKGLQCPAGAHMDAPEWQRSPRGDGCCGEHAFEQRPTALSPQPTRCYQPRYTARGKGGMFAAGDAQGVLAPAAGAHRPWSLLPPQAQQSGRAWHACYERRHAHAQLCGLGALLWAVMS